MSCNRYNVTTDNAYIIVEVTDQMYVLMLINVDLDGYRWRNYDYWIGLKIIDIYEYGFKKLVELVV